MSRPSKIAQVNWLIEKVHELYEPGNPGSLSLLSSAFRDFVHGGGAALVINAALSDLLGSTEKSVAYGHGELRLCEGPGWSVSVQTVTQNTDYIHYSSVSALYSPLDIPLEFDVYHLPLEFDSQVFDPQCKLKYAHSGKTLKGEVLALTGDQFAYDFKIRAPVAALKFVTDPVSSMEWLFNRRSLSAWQANDSQIEATKLRVAAYVLGRLAHQTSLEPLSALTSHANHSVRWMAIQSIGRIRRSVAVEKLKIAVDDPHPHVRRAAIKTLDSLR